MIKTLVMFTAILMLSGCTTAPPTSLNNICDIFEEERGWYKKARKSSRRWNTDIATMMAIVYQESSFEARAKPPRKKILWVIPGPRPASAYGYAQAIDSTWKAYQKATGKGGADRNEFGDAIDFIGWYNNRSQRTNKIARNDAYNLYLAYHEGHGGFVKRTYKNKQWLIGIATKVGKRATKYQTQLNSCEKKLNRGFFRRLFS